MKRNTQNFSLNGLGTMATNVVGSTIWGKDGLDKRNSDGRETLTGVINTVSSVADTISNALGNRNPYYIIGFCVNSTELEPSTSPRQSIITPSCFVPLISFVTALTAPPILPKYFSANSPILSSFGTSPIM